MKPIFAVAKVMTILVWFLCLSTLFIEDMAQFQLMGTGVLSFLIVAHTLECILFLRSPRFENVKNRFINSVGIFFFGAFHLIPLWAANQQKA